MDETPTLYERLNAAGCELNSHESDLYVKDTTTARKIIEEFNESRRTRHSISRFRHQVTDEWWIDIPFAFDPWWQKRLAR